MLKWTQGEVAIQIIPRDGSHEQRVTIAAEICGPFAIHRPTFIDEKGVGQDKDSWVLSHIGTGYSIKADLPSVRAAKKIAEGLNQLDWNFTSPKSKKIKKLGSDVKAVVASVLGETA